MKVDALQRSQPPHSSYASYSPHPKHSDRCLPPRHALDRHVLRGRVGPGVPAAVSLMRAQTQSSPLAPTAPRTPRSCSPFTAASSPSSPFSTGSTRSMVCMPFLVIPLLTESPSFDRRQHPPASGHTVNSHSRSASRPMSGTIRLPTSTSFARRYCVRIRRGSRWGRCITRGWVRRIEERR